MIRERVVAGLARAKAQGVRLGRRRTTPLPAGAPHGLTVRQAAKMLGCSKSTAARRLGGAHHPSVNTNEARQIVRDTLVPYREWSYAHLCALIDQPKRVSEAIGPSGAWYQIAVFALWDGSKGGDVRGWPLALPKIEIPQGTPRQVVIPPPRRLNRLVTSVCFGINTPLTGQCGVSAVNAT
jgi:hypothetical protein